MDRELCKQTMPPRDHSPARSLAHEGSQRPMLVRCTPPLQNYPLRTRLFLVSASPESLAERERSHDQTTADQPRRPAPELQTPSPSPSSLPLYTQSRRSSQALKVDVGVSRPVSAHRYSLTLTASPLCLLSLNAIVEWVRKPSPLRLLESGLLP